jgi:hypothetical protein
MTDRGDQAHPATRAADTSADAGKAKGSPPSAAAEQRVHLYEAVSARRDQVLNQFAGQRAAILKAVADQRAAAVAPILAVQTRRANESNPNEPAAAAMNPNAAAAPGAAPPPLTNAPIRRRSLLQFRRAIAADIVATIRTLVAAEVRAQLAAIDAAAKPPADPPQATPAESVATGEGAASAVE